MFFLLLSVLSSFFIVLFRLLVFTATISVSSCVSCFITIFIFTAVSTIIITMAMLMLMMMFVPLFNFTFLSIFLFLLLFFLFFILFFIILFLISLFFWEILYNKEILKSFLCENLMYWCNSFCLEWQCKSFLNIHATLRLAKEIRCGVAVTLQDAFVWSLIVEHAYFALLLLIHTDDDVIDYIKR